jgi:hypothetical protein
MLRRFWVENSPQNWSLRRKTSRESTWVLVPSRVVLWVKLALVEQGNEIGIKELNQKA